jgi:multidrug efflux pump
MNTDIFIKKPVFAIVLNLLIILCGLLSFSKLELRLYPNIEPSVITITTDYVGASAQDIETFITNPIEEALSGIEGLDYTMSKSSKGTSTITIYFENGYDLSKAISDVSNQVSSVKYLLPDDVNDSIIKEYDPEAQPVIWLSITSDKLSRNKITDYFLNLVQPQLQNLPGLAQATGFGRRDHAIRIKLNPIKIWGHNLSINEIITKIQQNNTYFPVGKVDTKYNQYDVSLLNEMDSADHFNNLVISKNNNSYIRLKDVATAEMSSQNLDKSAFFKDKPALFVGIYESAGANPILLSKAVQQKVDELKDNNSAKINILWDNSRFISEAIDEIADTIFEASLFVIIVILFFLGSVRAVFVPAVAIPVSLIGVMVFQLLLGYSLNTFTLLAMVLSIGMVVDDAIVVLENIHRHMEEGLSAMKAALVGASEIRFAVIAMTITLAAVFTPIGFIGGPTGKLFSEFAFTLAGAVIISGFVALTLSPMICAYTLKLSSGDFFTKIEKIFNEFSNKYEAVLNITIFYKKTIIALILIMMFLAGYLFFTIPSSTVPEEDSGVVLTFVNAPENANIDYMERNSKQIIDVFATVADAGNYGLVNGISGSNSAMGILTLKDWGKRDSVKKIIMNKLLPPLSKIPGVQAFPNNPFSVPGSSSREPVNFVIKTEKDYGTLYSKMEELVDYLSEKAPFLFNVQSSLKINKQDFNIKINRDAAQDLEVDTAKIAKAVFYALGEDKISSFVLNNRSYDIISEFSDNYKNNIENLKMLTVRSKNNELVPLSSLLDFEETIEADSLPHFQNMKSATLTALTVPGLPLGYALEVVEDAAKKIFSSTGYSFDYSGQSRDFLETQGHILPLFIYALIFIYLVLSAQYESFIDPFIILITVPLSTIGALLFLKLMGGSLNLYTNIGILTLVGLISKHGILIVDFANQLQNKNKKGALDAVINASKIRLRPILATTIAMILGAAPLLLANGPGAAARNEIGCVIIGGMFIGTIMTLFVVPTIYVMLSRHHETV